MGMGGTLVLGVMLAQAAQQQTGRPASTQGATTVETQTIDDGRGAPATEKPPARPELSASVDVRSDLGKRFRLVEERITLDGSELSHRTAARGEELEHSFRAYDGPVSPGSHTVSVTLVYEGRNAGPFTYLDGYRYRVESSADFTAEASARPAAIQVLAYERPGAMVPIEQKPTMEIKTGVDSSVTPVTRAASLTGH